ncbi:hypothetical protein [Actinomadura sp. 3N508]|uniref:hypothetical protein n=1 Tax=Actinomadura sp. 3N508 TaxID=3375153 RepID=UPI0037B54CFF
MRVTLDEEWAMISYAGRRRLTRHRITGARTFPDGAAAPTGPDVEPARLGVPGAHPAGHPARTPHNATHAAPHPPPGR